MTDQTEPMRNVNRVLGILFLAHAAALAVGYLPGSPGYSYASVQITYWSPLLSILTGGFLIFASTKKFSSYKGDFLKKVLLAFAVARSVYGIVYGVFFSSGVLAGGVSSPLFLFQALLFAVPLSLLVWVLFATTLVVCFKQLMSMFKRNTSLKALAYCAIVFIILTALGSAILAVFLAGSF